ncbi:MAG: flagellar hook-length control protein FliK [Candidatus Gastranaerophilales bacterium]|nr:flagellar hook-length control protein FliK [Candidatus Gastranaerophilales bacterium]
MNIETTIQTNKTIDTLPSTATVPASTVNNENSTTFKDELESIKTNDSTKETAKVPVKSEEQVAQIQEQKTNDTLQPDANPQTNQNIKNAQANNIQQTAKDKLKDEIKNRTNVEHKEDFPPVEELNAKIATLNELKIGIGKTQTLTADEKTSRKDDYCRILNMDNNDITFFVNLVENQQMTAQTSQVNNQNTVNNNFAEIKTEATQQTVQVSQTLLDALNNSMQTGKPVRIDFDKDIAVIIRVDKDGNLSANFIPGNAAVENYLRNNIASLRQSFDQQNLPYNELSYSNKQKQEQGNKNNKENENE